MKCKDIREWLLQDRSEENDPETDMIMAMHLQECADCREFQRRLQEDLLKPLREARVPVPPEIWLNIKETLMQAELEKSCLRPRLMSGWFSFFRPAYAVIVAAVFLIAAVLYIPYRNQQIVFNYFDSQADFLLELSEAQNGTEYSAVDFGTPIEEFLL